MDQTFIEAEVVKTGLSTNDVMFEGILGLSPKNGNSNLGMGNLVTNMYEQGLVEENAFTLSISHEEYEIGELVFGGISDNVRVTVRMISVSNFSIPSEDDIRASR